MQTQSSSVHSHQHRSQSQLHSASPSRASHLQLVTSSASQSPHRQLTLKQRARWMRRSPTTSEQLLWRYLRSRQQHGVQFRRQVVIGRYIVDFCASSLRLVVEVDGGYHANVVRLDAKREAKLTRMGYHVVRVPLELVVTHTQAAVHIVRSAVEQLLHGWAA